jgi:hypothetical protein
MASKYTSREDGEPNKYTILKGKNWFMSILLNGELSVEHQRNIINIILSKLNSKP